jgi:hypothetical protein
MSTEKTAEELAFESGYDDDTPVAQVVESEQIVEPEEKQAENPEEPQEIKVEQKETPKEHSDLESRLRKMEGRYGQLNSDIKAVLKTLKGPDGEIKIPTGKKMEALKSDFPEMADALEEQLTLVKGGAPAVNVEEIIGTVRDALEEQIKADVLTYREELKIAVKFPDWEDTVQTTEFSTWLSAQDSEMKKLAESDKAKDAIRLLTMYNERKKGRPDQNLKDNISPTRGARKQSGKAANSEEEAFLRAFS